MRKPLLVAVVAGLLVLGGCIGSPSQKTPTVNEGTDWPTVSTSADFGTNTPEPGVTDHVAVSDGTLVVNRTLSDEHAEYLQSSDSVRYVKAWRHSNHEEVENGSSPEREPVYGIMSFETWGRIQCSSTAADGVWTVLKERTTDSLDGVHTGSDTSDDQIQITVMRTTTIGRDGTVEAEPSIPLERLDAIAPEGASVEITFANRSYSCEPAVDVTNSTVYKG
ncbi:hypothetical protein [Halosimplex sp. J119]